MTQQTVPLDHPRDEDLTSSVTQSNAQQNEGEIPIGTLVNERSECFRIELNQN